MHSLNFVVTLVGLINLFIICNSLDHVQRSEKEKMCPCIEKEHCPRIYGKSAIDIREMGFLPACQDFGTVRCCGVSIRIEQDSESKKMDWANIDIKTKNTEGFRDTNSLSQREDDLDSSASDLLSTQRRPGLQKLRRRKPFQTGAKESTSQNYPDLPPKTDDAIPSANSAEVDPDTKSYPVPNYPAKSPQSKVPGNKNILKLRRPAFRPTGGAESSSTTASGSTTISSSGKETSQIQSITSTSGASESTGVRQKINSLVGGRKKISSSSFGATVSRVPSGGGNTPSKSPEVVQTLEIKEKFTPTPSSQEINLTLPPKTRYVPKIRPFPSKAPLASATSKTSEITEAVTESAAAAEEEVNLDMGSLLQQRPKPKSRIRVRLPVQTNNVNEENQMFGTPIILTTGKPEFHINRATNLLSQSQSQDRIRISTATASPTKTPLVANNVFETTEEKVGQLSPDSLHSSTSPDPEPEPLLTTKRVKYIRRRVRPKTTTDTTHQKPVPLVYTPTTTSSKDLVTQPDLTTTTSPSTTTALAPEPKQDSEPASELEPEPETMTTLVEIPSTPESTKVSYSVSSEVSDGKESSHSEDNISIPVKGKIAFAQVPPSAPSAPNRKSKENGGGAAVLIYSSPTRGHHSGQNSYYKTYDTQNYKDDAKPTIVTPTPFQPIYEQARTRGRRPVQKEVQSSENIKKSDEIVSDGERRRFRVPAQFIRSRGTPTVSQTKSTVDSLKVTADESYEAEQGEGSENYDLVLDKNSRETQSYKVLNPRQRNNRFPSTAPSLPDTPDHPVVYSLSSDLANHKDHYEYIEDDETAEESRTRNTRRRPNKNWTPQPNTDEDESVSTELVTRRPRPKVRKPVSLSQNNSPDDLQQPHVVVGVPVPVAVPVQIGNFGGSKPTRIPQRVTTSQTNNKRPAGYRRIKNKPALLQQSAAAVTESTTTTGGENDPRPTSFKVTEIMNSGSNDQFETSTAGWVFPPYRIHIAPSPTTTLSPSYAVEKEATNVIGSFSDNDRDSVGPLDVLRTPLATRRPPSRYNNNQDIPTEHNYHHQVQPTESTYNSYIPTTPIPSPQRHQQPQQHRPQSNFKRNSTRFGIPKFGPSMSSQSEIQPGHPDYVRFPSEETEEDYSGVPAKTLRPYSHSQVQTQTRAPFSYQEAEIQTESPYLHQHTVPSKPRHQYQTQTEAPSSYQQTQTKTRERLPTQKPMQSQTVINIGNTRVPLGPIEETLGNDNQEVPYSHHHHKAKTESNRNPYQQVQPKTRERSSTAKPTRSQTVINIGNTGDVPIRTNQVSTATADDQQVPPHAHKKHQTQTVAPYSHQTYQSQDQDLYSNVEVTQEGPSQPNPPRTQTIINIGNTGAPTKTTHKEVVTNEDQDYSKSVLIKAAGPLVDTSNGYSEQPRPTQYDQTGQYQHSTKTRPVKYEQTGQYEETDEYDQSGQYEHAPKAPPPQYDQTGQYEHTPKNRPKETNRFRPDVFKTPSEPNTNPPQISTGLNGKRPYHQYFDSSDQSETPTPSLNTVINITGETNNFELFRRPTPTQPPAPAPVNQVPIRPKEIPQVQPPSQPETPPVQQIIHSIPAKHRDHSSRFPISSLSQSSNQNQNRNQNQGQRQHMEGQVVNPPSHQPWNVPSGPATAPVPGKPDIRFQTTYPDNANRPPTPYQSPQPQFDIREPAGNVFQEVKPPTATAQTSPHYITEYHHHHDITQQILSRLRNTVRTSRATNLTLEDLNWLTGLVESQEKGNYNVTDEILADEGPGSEIDDDLEFELQDDEKVVPKIEKIDETTTLPTTAKTTTNATDPTTQKSKNLLGNESLVKNNEGKVENLGEDKPTAAVTESEGKNPNGKGRFRVPKMIHRGFFPLLPYSEEDPGPVLVNARSLGAEPSNGSGRNRRTSRDFKLFDTKDVVSLTTDSKGVPSPSIPIENGTGKIRMI